MTDEINNENNITEQATASETIKAAPKSGKEKLAGSLYDFVSIVGSAIITIMVVFTFFCRFVGVVGPSMEPTLYRDDWLGVTARLAKPESGDIVIITQPNAFDEPIVKRVIATAGQTIDIRDGRVYIDGEMKVEKYIAPDVYTEKENLDNYPLTVPENYIFVMGDNRPHSTDSRSSMIGLIREEYVLGKVMFRLMPIGNFHVGIEYDY